MEYVFWGDILCTHGVGWDDVCNHKKRSFGMLQSGLQSRALFILQILNRLEERKSILFCLALNSDCKRVRTLTSVHGQKFDKLFRLSTLILLFDNLGLVGESHTELNHASPFVAKDQELGAAIVVL